MSKDLSSEFEKIILISEKMLEHARQEQWDEVSTIEQQRKEMLAQFFSKPVGMHKADLSVGIRTILEKDREIVRLGSAKRDHLRNALQKFKCRKEAVAAYSAVG